MVYHGQPTSLNSHAAILQGHDLCLLHQSDAYGFQCTWKCPSNEPQWNLFEAPKSRLILLITYGASHFGSFFSNDVFDQRIVSLSRAHFGRSLFGNQGQGFLERLEIKLSTISFLDFVEEDVNVSRCNRLVKNLGVSSKFSEFGAWLINLL